MAKKSVITREKREHYSRDLLIKKELAGINILRLKLLQEYLGQDWIKIGLRKDSKR